MRVKRSSFHFELVSKKFAKRYLPNKVPLTKRLEVEK